MASDENDQRDEQKKPEGHATEGGFGTGLRAQLAKRRNGGEAESAPASAPEPEPTVEPPLVRFDLDTPTPVEAIADDPSPELE
jgi:hypothetical protein